MRKNIQKFRQRGFLLVDFLVGTVLIGVSLTALAPIALNVIDQRQESAAAAYQKRVADSARQWIKSNSPTILAGATAATPFVLNVSTLKSTGDLEVGWSTTNTFGQTPCVLILQPTPGKLQPMLLFEGGVAIKEARLRRIAQAGTAEGGFVDPNTPTPLTARGGFGTFNVDLTNYTSRNCSGVTTGPGRPVAALLFDPGQQQAPFLYANPVPGNVNANTMNTNLNMGGNNINNVNQVNATTVNATTVNTGTLNATGNINSECLVSPSNPAFFTCPAGTSNHNITIGNTFAANQYFGRTNNAYSVVPDLTSNMNQVVAENVTARRFFDKDNAAFYVDPASTSIIANSYVTDRSITARLSSMLPKFVQEALSPVAVDGDLVPKEICADGGQPYVFTIPKDIVLGPDYTAKFSASDAGANWRVNIKDSGNNAVAGSTSFVNGGCYQP
jgi:type II secretory pathway pseudopilin PulG